MARFALKFPTVACQPEHEARGAFRMEGYRSRFAVPADGRQLTKVAPAEKTERLLVDAHVAQIDLSN